jgi:hypothetical protein
MEQRRKFYDEQRRLYHLGLLEDWQIDELEACGISWGDGTSRREKEDKEFAEVYGFKNNS